MLWLSDEAIEYAVAKCRRERGYRIIIAIPNRNRIQDIEYVLRGLIRDADEAVIRRPQGGLNVEFNTGSCIKVLSASDSARGHRSHLLIADKCIDDEIIDCVLRPYENLDRIDRQNRRNTVHFRAEYLSRPIERTCLWEGIFLNNEDCKEFADVSEDEFINILNAEKGDIRK